MTIRFKCCKCGKPFKVKDEDIGKKGVCPCGEILTIPSPQTSPIDSNSSYRTHEESISESFMAISISLIALILIFSFICGVFLSRPNKASIAAQVKQINLTADQIKNESEQLKKNKSDYQQRKTIGD